MAGGKKKKMKSGKDPHKGKMKTTRKKTMKKKSGRDPHARKR